jgi:Spy/CpxP family protein refolding chaperone
VSLLDWRGTAIVLTVFVSGIAVGALGTRHLAQRHLDHALDGREGRGMERMLLRAIDHRVGLDDAQRDRIAAILEHARRERVAILGPVEPSLDEHRRRVEARVREVLRPDQRPSFDALADRLAERHRRGLPPPGPPGPPEREDP